MVSIKWENDPTDHLTGDLRKHFVDEFMVSVAGFEPYTASSIGKHGTH